MVNRRRLALLNKEFTDLLRDYKAILLIMLPVFLYPFLIGGQLQLVKHTVETSETESVNIGITGEDPLLIERLKKKEKLTFRRIENSKVKESIEQGKVDVVVTLPDNFKNLILSRSQKRPEVEVSYDSSKSGAFSKLSRTKSILVEYRNELNENRLKDLGLDKAWWNVLKFDYSEGIGGVNEQTLLLAMTLPYMFAFLVLISSYYAALDTVTGERERSTLALLLTAPADRRDIMLSKFLVVYFMSALSLIMSLLGCWAAFHLGLFTIDESASLNLIISPLTAFLLVLLNIPLIAIISAFSMYVSAYGKTYQQGAYLMMPIFIVVVALTAVSSLPNMELASLVAFIPLANLSLAIKEVVSGLYNWPWLAVAFISSWFYSLFFIRLASRLLEREDILFEIKKSPEAIRQSGNLKGVMCLLGITILMMLYIGGPAQAIDVVAGIIGSQVVVCFIPALIFLKITKLPVWSTLNFRRTSWLMILAVLLLLPAEMFWMHLLSGFLVKLFPGGESYMEFLTRILIENDRPVWLLVVAIGIFPGICEEVLFRGAILGTLMKNKDYSTLKLCSIVGIMFGIMHMSVVRFLPTTILGMLLTWLAIRTRSIFPSILLHVLNNTMAIILVLNKVEVVSWGGFIASCLGIIGFWLIIKKTGSGS